VSPIRFTHALVRTPGPSIVHGLRAGDGPDPDFDQFLTEHRGYQQALVDAGVQVVDLGALNQFPDAVFVEDAALCVGELAVALRPGAPSRAGEADAMVDDLRPWFGEVVRLNAGHVDGGDVLVTGQEVLVGCSARTNPAGVAALAEALAPQGLPVRLVDTPAGVLHFKTDCAVLDDTTVFATRRLADLGCFDRYRVLLAPDGEEAAANLIRVNDTVLVRSGFPHTCDELRAAGYAVVVVDADHAARVDGGLSCMSLRCTPPIAAGNGTGPGYTA
jgi:dimethylargininase